MVQEAVQQFIARELDEYLKKKPVPINSAEIQRLIRELTHEMTGLGPLEELLRDDAIEDIFINGYNEIYITRNGKLERCNVRFIDDKHVIRIVHRILAPLGRRLDESSPMVDARLPDGSRINAIIPPLAIDGPAVSIRKFRSDPLKAGDMLAYGTLTQDMLEFLQAAVGARCNILISGGTGAGKTTLLNILAQYIGENERVVTIEDAAELRLHHEHVVRLETRPGLENQTEIIGPRPDAQFLAHAPRPHHSGRSARRGSGRIASGDEYRPRRINEHHPCQLAARVPASSAIAAEFRRLPGQRTQPRPSDCRRHRH